MNLSNQQQIRIIRLNETIMANNEEHRSKNRQIQEQLKNLTQTYDDLNEKYVNKVMNRFSFLFMLFL
jgi:ABC-type transporter Mla subunit MlaD